MDRIKIEKLFKEFKESKLSLDGALEAVGSLFTEDIGYAHVDHHRQVRCGVPEVIFAEGKTVDQVVGIAKRLAEQGPVLATRVKPEQAEALENALKGVRYVSEARIARIGRAGEPGSAGKVAVISAGTSDQPVAEEAAETADFLGADVQRFYDIGVAGIHRLTEHIGDIRSRDVMIVVAGMEGALASVVGGMVSRPVIGVPTSIGYGASFGGVAALLGMLTSCASNVCVVNINNGFGAGVLASLIGRMASAAGGHGG